MDHAAAGQYARKRKFSLYVWLAEEKGFTLNNHETVLLWPDGAPGTENWMQEERDYPPSAAIDVPIVRNVVAPRLTVVLPDPQQATGTGVIVCPGGAFHLLAIEHEGTQVAEWLVKRGITAFILRYRVAPTAADPAQFVQEMHETMADSTKADPLLREIGDLAIADGLQAVRLVRQQAATWNLDPEKIGIMGFSAGGVVTIGVATRYDAASRPNFAAPIYTAPLEIAEVPADAPPLFMALATNDPMAVGASLPLFSKWRAAGHSAEMHVYSQGGHGFGMRTLGYASDTWIEQFGAWMRTEGF